jgi:hypothetical protein
MDPRTMRHLVKEDLGLESRVIVQRLLLTTDAQETRKERCQKLINKLKASQPRQVQIFSDEKIFTVDVAVNSRYLTDLPVADVDPDVRISPKSKAPLKQMVLGVIGSDGQKCPIIFVSRQTLQRRRLSGPFAEACCPLDPADVSGRNYVFQ